MEENSSQSNKYDAALAKYNTNLSDADIQARVADLIEKKVPENNTEEVKKLLFNCIDLTTLNSTDSDESVMHFTEKVNEFDNEFPDMKNIAAICVYPNFADIVKNTLQVDGINIACVSGGFPSSQTFIEVKVAETALAIADGADEIDIVISIGKFLSGDYETMCEEIQELKVQVYEEQLEKQKTKIDYLQLQIRPHFYINCLNSIYSMAQLKHTEEIQQLALYVSGYMRSIFRKGTKPILMDEELQQIVNYVKIHNILYRYDCKCHICVDERVKQAMIPPLIMIVFVENCVKYTVGSKRKIEISIEGSFLDEEQKKIQIRIADNGPGFPENVLEKFRKNEFGANDDRFQIGIRNTKDRLQLLYGAEASLMIGNGENLGTEVIIIIPYQNGDEKSEYSISR